MNKVKLSALNLMMLTMLGACGDKNKDYYCSGEDIFVQNDKVYVVGSICQGSSKTDVPTLWINGESQSIGQMGNFNKATSVFVDRNDVYVTVTEAEQNRAYLWKNGEIQELGNQRANSVIVKDGDVYVVGCDDDMPTLWKNGIPQYLYGQGEAKSIFVDGEDIYIVGYIGDYFSGNAVLWKNGNREILSDKTSIANDIVIANGNVYIAGEENHNATLWLNGESQCLSNEKSSAYSVAVSGDTVFVTGVRGFNYKGSPEYGIWKNGTPIEVCDEIRSQIVSVKISNNVVYFSGSSKNMEPLWKINL